MIIVYVFNLFTSGFAPRETKAIPIMANMRIPFTMVTFVIAFAISLLKSLLLVAVPIVTMVYIIAIKKNASDAISHQFILHYLHVGKVISANDDAYYHRLVESWR